MGPIFESHDMLKKLNAHERKLVVCGHLRGGNDLDRNSPMEVCYEGTRVGNLQDRGESDAKADLLIVLGFLAQ